MTSQVRLWVSDLDGQGTPGWRDSLSGTEIVHGGYGTYIPSSENTGFTIPEASLTAYNSSSVDQVTLPDGALIENKIIYGDIRPPSTHTSDIIIRNCLLVGGANDPSTEDGVVNCANGVRSGTGKIKLYNCEIRPRHPTNNRDGIRGYRWEAYSCNIHSTVDGVGIFSTPAQGTNTNVTIMGCWIHDLCYVTPDPAHASTDNQTHNDCVQFQGGRNVHIKGNRFDVTVGTIIGTPPVASQPRLDAGHANNGTLLQDNVGTGSDTTVVVEDNWYSSGINQTQIKAEIVAVVQNNHYYVATWNNHIQIETGATITGINTNVWADGPNVGQILTTANGGLEYI